MSMKLKFAIEVYGELHTKTFYSIIEARQGMEKFFDVLEKAESDLDKLRKQSKEVITNV